MNTPTKTAVICDLDGTLVDVSQTIHHILVEHNLDRFHNRTNNCAPVVEWVRNWCEHQHQAYGHTVLLLTGRTEKYRPGTREWLGRHIRTDGFIGPIMRANADRRSDDQVKRDAFAALREAGYDIVAAIDDRPRVLALWRDLGLDPIVCLRPDWAGSGEPYSAADEAAWIRQRGVRLAHGWVPDDVEAVVFGTD